MITSGLSRGTCVIAIVAASWRRTVPAPNGDRLTNSVRACREFGVVAPCTGAHSVSPPSASLVSHGGLTAAGSTVAALPFFPAIGRVSFHPARLGGPATTCDPVTTEGCGVPVTAHATDITQVSTRTDTMASGGGVKYRGHSGDAMGYLVSSERGDRH